jgi:hypothetical protein
VDWQANPCPASVAHTIELDEHSGAAARNDHVVGASTLDMIAPTLSRNRTDSELANER